MGNSTRPGRRVLVLVVTLALVTSVLGPGVGVVAAASEGEPNDTRETAERISVGESIDGTVSGDADWFSFEASAGETINVTTVAGAGGTNNVKLVDRDGDTITGGDVSDGSGSVGTTATYSGTYYVQITKDFYANSGADYELTVDTFETDSFEANEDRANAVSLSVGQPVSGQLPIGDTDWFSFEASAGETINVTMAAGAGGTNNVKLIDRNGDTITGVDVSDGMGNAGTTATYSGTYYVQVAKDFYADSGADYDLNVRTYRTDPFEPNEQRANASRLYENPFVPTPAEVSIGDADWFEYRLTAGETIRIETGVPPGDGTHVTRIFRPGENSHVNSSTAEPGSTVTVEYTAQETGMHSIAVLKSFYGGLGPYSITITAGGETVGPPNDRFERGNPPLGNQDRANATDLDGGVYTDLGMVDDDRDVFAVDLQANERVTAIADFTHAENDIGLELQDASGATVASADTDTDDERLAVNATAAETHYLVVTGESGAAAQYDLNLTVTTVGAPTTVEGRFGGSDGEIGIVDVLDTIGAFNAGREVGGQAVTLPDVLSVISAFNQN